MICGGPRREPSLPGMSLQRKHHQTPDEDPAVGGGAGGRTGTEEKQKDREGAKAESTAHRDPWSPLSP